MRSATLPSLKDSGELREPRLPPGSGERVGFRVSTCDEGISPTDAARFDWRRCLPRPEFEWRLDATTRPQSTPAGGSEHSVASILRLSFCNATVYDRMPPVQHLRGLPLRWRRPRTRSGTAAVVRISAGLDCAAVSPVGSVVVPRSALFHATNFCMNTRVVTRVASAVLQVGACSSCGSRKEPQRRHWPPYTQTLLPSLFRTLVM